MKNKSKRLVNTDGFNSVQTALRFGYDNRICSFILETGLSEEYQLPYYDILPGDPCFEEVREVVLTANRRPLIPSEWFKDEVRLVHNWQSRQNQGETNNAHF